MKDDPKLMKAEGLKAVSFHLRPSEVPVLRELADATEVSLSEYIRRLVRPHIAAAQNRKVRYQ